MLITIHWVCPFLQFQKGFFLVQHLAEMGASEICSNAARMFQSPILRSPVLVYMSTACASCRKSAFTTSGTSILPGGTSPQHQEDNSKVLEETCVTNGRLCGFLGQGGSNTGERKGGPRGGPGPGGWGDGGSFFYLNLFASHLLLRSFDSFVIFQLERTPSPLSHTHISIFELQTKRKN